MPLRTCVGAVLVSKQQVLLMHRRLDRTWSPDTWDIPGGHVELEESLTDALVRELREELRIEMKHPSNSPFRVIADEGFRLSVWIVTRWIGTPINGAENEHDEMRWVVLRELEDLRLAHPAYLELLQTAISIAGHDSA